MFKKCIKNVALLDMILTSVSLVDIIKHPNIYEDGYGIYKSREILTVATIAEMILMAKIYKKL